MVVGDFAIDLETVVVDAGPRIYCCHQSGGNGAKSYRDRT